MVVKEINIVNTEFGEINTEAALEAEVDNDTSNPQSTKITKSYVTSSTSSSSNTQSIHVSILITYWTRINMYLYSVFVLRHSRNKNMYTKYTLIQIYYRFLTSIRSVQRQVLNVEFPSFLKERSNCPFSTLRPIRTVSLPPNKKLPHSNSPLVLLLTRELRAKLSYPTDPQK